MQRRLSATGIVGWMAAYFGVTTVAFLVPNMVIGILLRKGVITMPWLATADDVLLLIWGFIFLVWASSCIGFAMFIAWCGSPQPCPCPFFWLGSSS